MSGVFATGIHFAKGGERVAFADGKGGQGVATVGGVDDGFPGMHGKEAGGIEFCSELWLRECAVFRIEFSEVDAVGIGSQEYGLSDCQAGKKSD